MDEIENIKIRVINLEFVFKQIAEELEHKKKAIESFLIILEDLRRKIENVEHGHYLGNS